MYRIHKEYHNINKGMITWINEQNYEQAFKRINIDGQQIIKVQPH